MAITSGTTPEQFTGYASKGKGKSLEPWSYTPKPFEPTDVDIKITHCGICGSDVHTLDSGWGPTTYPVIVGHEIVGEVIRVGSEVKDLKVGQRVGVGARSGSCNQCEECLRDEENYCSGKATGTYNATYADGSRSQGGYANYTRVPSNWVFPVPEHLESDAAASLFCAGITTYLPLKAAKVGPDTAVGVVGIGGLGHLGLQWARALDAKKVVAISHSDRKREDAKELGATEFLALSDTESLKAANRTLDVLLVAASGSRTNWKDLLSLMRTGGRVMLVGLPEEPLGGIPPMLMAARRIALIGSLIGSPKDTREMLQVAADKNVRVWYERRPMSKVNEALQDFRDGKARYRYVLEN
ncbi:MAG: chaperonin 10-like protein [Piptocephalis tieghemiana]|nr:MAG: chaperonin 10-like protein [Piptocephalis tieghemiana]